MSHRTDFNYSISSKTMNNHFKNVILILLVLSNTRIVKSFVPTTRTSKQISASSIVLQADSSDSSTTTTNYNKKLICEFESDDFPLASGSWPYDDKTDMSRIDQTDDSKFYDAPRFVTHIDDRAIESLTNFYYDEMTTLLKKKKSKKNGDDGLHILDLCSSWISHLPASDEKNTEISYSRVVGVGMNEEELQRNKQLTEYYVQDLNKEPNLSSLFPDDESFDVICNVVSVDYLTKPKEIFEEIYRLLRPGGIALISFSNRCFATKAISMWLREDDIGRMSIVGSYFHYSSDKWNTIEAYDISSEKMKVPDRPSMNEMFQNPSKGFAWMNTAAAVQKANAGDPMFVIKGVK